MGPTWGAVGPPQAHAAAPGVLQRAGAVQGMGALIPSRGENWFGSYLNGVFSKQRETHFPWQVWLCVLALLWGLSPAWGMLCSWDS